MTVSIRHYNAGKRGVQTQHGGDRNLGGAYASPARRMAGTHARGLGGQHPPRNVLTPAQR